MLFCYLQLIPSILMFLNFKNDVLSQGIILIYLIQRKV